MILLKINIKRVTFWKEIHNVEKEQFSTRKSVHFEETNSDYDDLSNNVSNVILLI